jgi:hypothetical protein
MGTGMRMLPRVKIIPDMKNVIAFIMTGLEISHLY